MEPGSTRPFIDGPGTVVVGVDGSPASARALEFGFRQAAREGGQVVAVHVARTGAFDTFGVVSTMCEADLAGELRPRVAELAEKFGVPALFTIEHGDVSGSLIRVAQEHLADTIVLGASASPVHRLLGSAPAGVVKRCPCPVVVIP